MNKFPDAMQKVQWVSLKFSRSFVSFFALRMHKLHLCIQLIRAADHVIINIAWSLAWSIRNDNSLFAFSHAGLVEGFSCLLCWFWHLNFSFRLVFSSFPATAEETLSWWNSNIVWVSENLKRNMKRFQGDSSGRKVFFRLIQWLAWWEYMIRWLQAHPRLRFL